MPGLLCLALAVPALGAMAIGLMPGERQAKARWVAVFALGLALMISGIALGRQPFEEMIPWVSDLGLAFRVRVDGFSALLLLTVTAVNFARLAAVSQQAGSPRLRCALLLGAQSAAAVAVTAHDAGLWWIAFAAWGMLEAMGHLESSPHGGLAASRMLWMVGAGLAPVLVVVLIQGAIAGTLDLTQLWQNHPLAVAPADTQQLVWGVLVLGFAPLLVLFPFHGAYVGAARGPWGMGWLALSPLVALSGLLRLGMVVMPTPAQHGHEFLMGAALFGAIYAGWGAWSAAGAERRLAFVGMMLAAMSLLALSSFEAAGLSLAMAMIPSHALLLAWIALADRAAGGSASRGWWRVWGPVGGAGALFALVLGHGLTLSAWIVGVLLAGHALLVLWLLRRRHALGDGQAVVLEWPAALLALLLLACWAPGAGWRWLGVVSTHLKPYLGL